ncbi:transposase [Brevibacillus gelatini]|uniref:transposase n=1 Tax=Brevibacillus gelatini TaxID=1655277 RepID=UPI003D81B3A7
MKKYRYRRFTYEFKWEVLKQCLDGMSIFEVAKKYGVTEEDIQKWIRQSGIRDLLQSSKKPEERIRQLKRAYQRERQEKKNLIKLLLKMGK